MNKLTSFQYYHNSKTLLLDVILHGGSKGIESSFIQKIFGVCKKVGHSVIAFNFSYLERGEENSSGPELKEELETLREILKLTQYEHHEHIRLIGKSLGGIVASYFLNDLPKAEQKRFEIIILGYIAGDTRLKNFPGKLTIIQGEKDKFGGIEIVKDNLKNTKSKEVYYHQIAGADHSFRAPETKEPIYEEQVIALLETTSDE